MSKSLQMLLYQNLHWDLHACISFNSHHLFSRSQKSPKANLKLTFLLNDTVGHLLFSFLGQGFHQCVNISFEAGSSLTSCILVLSEFVVLALCFRMVRCAYPSCIPLWMTLKAGNCRRNGGTPHRQLGLLTLHCFL